MRSILDHKQTSWQPCLCDQIKLLLYSQDVDEYQKYQGVKNFTLVARLREKCHISCSFLKLHVNRARYSVCCSIAMAQNEQEMP